MATTVASHRQAHQDMAVLHKVTNHSLLQPRLASLAEYHGAVGSVWCPAEESNPVLRLTKPLHHQLCLQGITLYRVSTPVRRDLLPGVKAIGVPMDSHHTFATLPLNHYGPRITAWVRCLVPVLSQTWGTPHSRRVCASNPRLQRFYLGQGVPDATRIGMVRGVGFIRSLNTKRVPSASWMVTSTSDSSMARLL